MNKQFYKISIQRTQSTFVIIKAQPGQRITVEMMRDAAHETILPEEWDVVGLKFGEPTEISEGEAGEFQHYETTPEKSLSARAKEIGVSVVTLRKWRDDCGVDIFNDCAVKKHVSSQRVHNWKISPHFKPSL